MKQVDRSNYTRRIFFLFIVIFFGLSNSLSAQFKIFGIVDVEGGKKYHGEVISYEPLKTVTLNYQGDTLTFNLSEHKFKFSTRKPPKPYIFPDGTGYHRIDLGTLPGRPGDGVFLGYTYHFQRTRLIGYGGGLSFENYGDVDGYDFLVPKIAYFAYFSPNNVSPFFKATAGYGISLKNSKKEQTKASGGINLGAAIGVRLSTNKVMIDFAIGAKLQKAYYDFDRIDYFETQNRTFRRFDFSIGFMW